MVDGSKDGSSPAHRERTLRQWEAEGKIAIHDVMREPQIEPWDGNEPSTRLWTNGFSRSISIRDPSFGEEYRRWFTSRKPGTRLFFTFEGERRFVSNAGDYVDGLVMGINGPEEYPTEEEALVASGLAALGQLQTYLAHEVKQPWPDVGSGKLPQPGATMTGRILHLWYGPSSSPALSFPPIDVDA
jgi:hypothetical protein